MGFSGKYGYRKNPVEGKTKMTEVYLGKPPAYIETWMKENIYTEKWVPAVYTDNWLFSDGETRNVVF